MDFEFNTENFADAIEKAEKQLPYSTEKTLRKVTTEVAKDLNAKVEEEAKGHNYYYPDGTHLEESFRCGKVVKHGKKWTCAATSRAPHYHLYEEGHDLYTHTKKNRIKDGNRKRKTKKGRGSIKKGRRELVGYGQYIRHVEGKKTVAKYMGKRSDRAEEIAEEILNEILKEAGLS